mgnify:CR=1 FL=1
MMPQLSKLDNKEVSSDEREAVQASGFAPPPEPSYSVPDFPQPQSPSAAEEEEVAGPPKASSSSVPVEQPQPVASLAVESSRPTPPLNRQPSERRRWEKQGSEGDSSNPSAPKTAKLAPESAIRRAHSDVPHSAYKTAPKTQELSQPPREAANGHVKTLKLSIT